MGIGTKIKEALKGDSHDDTGYDRSENTPGAYPHDEVPPHGSATGNTTGNTTKMGSTGHSGSGTAGATSSGTAPLSSSGTQHNTLHKKADQHDLNPEHHSKTAQTHQYRDPGVGQGIDRTSTRDQTSQGNYWGDLGQGSHGTTKDMPDRSYRGHDTTGMAGTAGHRGHHGHHDPRLTDQAAVGGVHNSVTGAGSQEHSGHSRMGPSAGAVHDPLTSGTKGTNLPSGNTYDQQSHLRGEGAPTSRSHHGGSGPAGAGAAAGAGVAAGYGADKLAHRGHENAGYGTTGAQDPALRETQGHGVPRSSMLDPEPAGTSQSQPRSQGYEDVPTTTSNSQPHSQGAANTIPTGSSSQPIGHAPGSNSATSDSGGLGTDHHGPGHEGAKVLHKCQHCGGDNDISQYFRKETVYRIGS